MLSQSYCAMIWDSHHQNAINKIEMIQHCAARFVLNRPWQIHHHLRQCNSNATKAAVAHSPIIKNKC